MSDLMDETMIAYLNLMFRIGKIVGAKKSARPKGKWIEEYNGNGWNDYWDYTCSNCGKRYERADAILCKANFCPHCGANMREYKESE